MPALAHCCEEDPGEGHDFTSTEIATFSIELHDHLAWGAWDEWQYLGQLTCTSQGARGIMMGAIGPHKSRALD